MNISFQKSHKININGLLFLSVFLGIAFPQNKKPNIIFLLTDDQRWDAVAALGMNKIIQTPTMDALAKEGVMFKNAYVTTAICGASRASIYLGQHQNRATNDSIINFGELISNDRMKRTIHGLMQSNGYYTGFVGKWHLSKASLTGFDYLRNIWDKYEQKDENGKYLHLTKMMGNQALEFLDGVPKDKPFYLNMCTKAPHAQDPNPAGVQFPPDPDLLPLYSNIDVPMPPSADPAFFEKLPPFLKKGIVRTRWQLRFGIFKEKIDIDGDGTPDVYDIWQDGVKDYYRLVTGIDRQLARIRAKLVEIGQQDNTIIVLIGDNGMYLGERGYAGKWLAHEHSIRVPLIVYDPRAPKNLQGQLRDEMALNIDVAPTILTMAGIPIPKEMQGHALQPLLTNQASQWRSDFFYEHPMPNIGIQYSEGLVEQRYKYIRYIEDPFIELYDVIKDPYEMDNLAYKMEFKPKLDSMISRFKDAKKSAYNDNEIKERLVPVTLPVSLNSKLPMFPKIHVQNTFGILQVTHGIPNTEFQIFNLNGEVAYQGKFNSYGEAKFNAKSASGAGTFILKMQDSNTKLMRNEQKIVLEKSLFY